MFAVNYIDNFDTFMRKNIYAFKKRVSNIVNTLVQTNVLCAMATPNSIWDKWATALYTHS